jgi:hypothetical protein
LEIKPPPFPPGLSANVLGVKCEKRERKGGEMQDKKGEKGQKKRRQKKRKKIRSKRVK